MEEIRIRKKEKNYIAVYSFYETFSATQVTELLI
jgi:hypothetical protein